MKPAPRNNIEYAPAGSKVVNRLCNTHAVGRIARVVDRRIFQQDIGFAKRPFFRVVERQVLERFEAEHVPERGRQRRHHAGEFR